MSRRVVCLILAAACADAPPAIDSNDRIDRPVEVCAAGETVDGIDVSYWQGTIDWSQVAASGIQFAIIRVTHGLGVIDTRFEANWSGARENGIIRGAYQYFEPDDDPIAQADLFLDRLGPLEPGDLPPVLDVEEAGSLSPVELTDAVRVWLDRVEAATGRPPMIYAGKYFWRDQVGSLEFADHPFWIAQWGVTCPDLPAPWSDWAFHQTSASGSVPGISGPVDTDVFNGSLDELIAFAAGEPPVPPQPCAPIPAEGRVVDDVETCFRAGGSPASIRRVDDAGWDGRLLWTYTTDWPDEDNFAIWSLDFARAGTYRLEVHTPAPWSQSRAAAYEVAHAGTVARFVVDQTANDGWTALGELEFAAGGDQFVRVGDNTGEPLATQTRIVFDAIRVSPVAAPQPPRPPRPVEPPSVEPPPGFACSVSTARAPSPSRSPSPSPSRSPSRSPSPSPSPSPSSERGAFALLVVVGVLLVFSRRRRASTLDP